MLKLFRKNTNKKGFTLIELIIVIALLGVIAAIAVPRYGNVLEEAKKESDIITAQMVEKAAELYYFQNPIDTEITLKDLADKDYIDSETITPQAKDNENKVLEISAPTSTGDITVTWKDK